MSEEYWSAQFCGTEGWAIAEHICADCEAVVATVMMFRNTGGDPNIKLRFVYLAAQQMLSVSGYNS